MVWIFRLARRAAYSYKELDALKNQLEAAETLLAKKSSAILSY
ncbi:hypothetical protein [Hymenobacter terricola]|nr:hypothetical protein [Hymenobacter terricola]